MQTSSLLKKSKKQDFIVLFQWISHFYFKDSISQAYAALLPVKSVGVMGDQRTYEQMIALRAVETSDFMTADWFKMPYDVLKVHFLIIINESQTVSSRIINEVKGVNRVLYDISSKPPATIEME